MVHRDALAGRRERQRGCLAGRTFDLFEQWTRECAHIEALQHVGAELKQADAKPKATCGRHFFDQSVRCQRA